MSHRHAAPEPRQVPALTVDPGVDPAAAAPTLLVASAQVDDLGTFVAGDARIGDWTGAARRPTTTGSGRSGRQADAMSLALRGVAQRVDAHAEEMDAPARPADRPRGLAPAPGQRRSPTCAAGSTEATEDRGGRAAGRGATGCAARSSASATDVTTWTTDLSTEEQAMALAFTRVLTLDAGRGERTAASADPADAALATKPPAGASPQEVYAWWHGLTEEQRQAIIAAAPGCDRQPRRHPRRGARRRQPGLARPRPRPAGRLRGQRLDHRPRARPARERPGRPGRARPDRGRRRPGHR